MIITTIIIITIIIIIITINKGERSDCNNYRGISLLSIVGKVFARVILVRLQKLAGRVYPDSQCAFRAERSTVDMVFSLRAASGEVQGTADATARRFHRSHEGVRPCQQRGSLQNPAQDWLPTQAAELDWVLPQQHAGDPAVQRQHLGVLQHLQRGQTGVVSSRQLSSGSSSPCFWSMHLARQEKGSTCVRDQMAVFSILPASEPRPNYAKPLSETCCLPTMRQ